MEIPSLKAKVPLLIWASLQAKNFRFQQYRSLLPAFLALMFILSDRSSGTSRLERTGFSRFCIVRCVFWCCGGEISLGKITVDDACTSATDVIVLVFSCKPSKTIYIKSYYSAVSRLPRDEYQESTPFSPSGHRPHASLS